MASIDRANIAGRYVGLTNVSSVGAWTDISLTDWTSITDEAIPASGVQVVSLSIRETGATNPAYVLFRANAGEATSAAFEIAAGGAEVYQCYLPDNSIDTIAIYGEAHVKAFFV